MLRQCQSLGKITFLQEQSVLEAEAESQKHRISGGQNYLLLIKKSVAAIFNQKMLFS